MNSTRTFALLFLLACAPLGARQASHVGTTPVCGNLATLTEVDRVQLQGEARWDVLKWSNGAAVGFVFSPEKDSPAIALYSSRGELTRTVVPDKKNHLADRFLVDVASDPDQTLLAITTEQKIPMYQWVRPTLVTIPSAGDPSARYFAPGIFPYGLCISGTGDRYLLEARLFVGIYSSLFRLRNDDGKTMPTKPVLESFRLNDEKIETAPVLLRGELNSPPAGRYPGEAWLACGANKLRYFNGAASVMYGFDGAKGAPQRLSIEQPLIHLSPQVSKSGFDALIAAKATWGSAVTESGRTFALVGDRSYGVHLFELIRNQDSAEWVDLKCWSILEAPYRRLVGTEGEDLVFLGKHLAEKTLIRVKVQEQFAKR